MLWFIVGLVLGFGVGRNTREKEVVDYSKIDAKLKNDLSVAQNLNQSLAKDKNDLREEIWKLKQKVNK
jgi:glucose-6-phosphate-specific signal transduction histidine kinase